VWYSVIPRVQKTRSAASSTWDGRTRQKPSGSAAGCEHSGVGVSSHRTETPCPRMRYWYAASAPCVRVGCGVGIAYGEKMKGAGAIRFVVVPKCRCDEVRKQIMSQRSMSVGMPAVISPTEEGAATMARRMFNRDR